MFGASRARALVVERSSSGDEIALRLIEPAFLMLIARLGCKWERSAAPCLLRPVSARASSIAMYCNEAEDGVKDGCEDVG